MSDIDDLIASLAFGQAQKQLVAEADPYSGGASVADAISNLAVSAGPQYKTRDKIILGALSGLTGGLFTGASQDYQNRAQDAYTNSVMGLSAGKDVAKPSVLSDSLFSGAKQQSNLFKLRQALTANDMAGKLAQETKLAEMKGEQDLKAEVAKELIKNPRRAQQLAPVIQSLFGAKGGSAMPVQAIAAPTETEIVSGVDADQSGMGLALNQAGAAAPVVATPPPAIERQPVAASRAGTPEEEAIATYNRIYDATGDDAYAKSAADNVQKAALEKQIIEDKRKLEESKTIGEQAASMQTSKRILSELDAAIEGAGTTGNLLPFGIEESARDFNVGLQTATGVEGADVRQGARRNLNALGIDFAGQVRKAFPGPVSEREFLKYLEASPGTDKTVAENKALADRMRRMTQAAEASNAFVQKQIQKGRTLPEALTLYSELDEAVPLFVPDQTGSPTINPARLNLNSQVDQTAKETAAAPAATPSTDSALQNVGKVAKSFVQGVAKTPQAIGAIFSPSTYKQAFSTPETAARTVGTGAAMMAGGSIGATVGALGGPLAPVTVPLGAAIGSGLGYLGFGSAEEAGSELAGVGTERPVVPGMKEIQEAADISGQGLGVGGVVKAVQTVGKGVGAVAKGTAGLADEAVQGAKSELIGVKASDLRKAVKNNAAQYVDDAGNTVPLKDATTYQSKVEQALKVVDDDGVFTAAKNDPKAMRVEFDKKARVAAQEISDLHNSTDAALQQIHAQLSKIQQKQFPLQRDPLTNKGGFLPNKADFAPVFDRIREIGKTDPQMVPILTKRANAVIQEWNKTSRSYNAMQDRKALFGAAAKWGKGTTAVTDAWNLVKQDVNRVFADAQNAAFEFAAQQSNPALSGALKSANSKFAAYKTLEPIMKAKGATGKPGFEIGTLGSGIPGSLFRRSPATALGAAEKASTVANAPIKAYNALTRQRGGQRGAVSSQFIDDAAALAGSGARLLGKNARILPGALNEQDDIDLAMSQARANVQPQAVATPQPMEEKAMPVNPIVSEFEGGQQLTAYPPPARGSGVTVATGIDLGQRSLSELKNLGLSEPLIKKVTPYLGKKDAEARTLIKKKPLSLTQEEADELDNIIGGSIGAEVNKKFMEATGQDIALLPSAAQTVIASLAHNFGPNLDKKIPTIWDAIVSGDWATVQDRLRNTKWKQPELALRRNREADILSELV